MTNYVGLETLFEQVWEQLSLQSKNQSQYIKTRASKAIIKWNLDKFTHWPESDYKQNPHAQFLTTVWPEIEPRYGTNYAVLLAWVMWPWETLSSSWKVIAIVWPGTRIADLLHFAISISRNQKFAIMLQAL